MSQKGRKDRKAATGRPLEAGKSAPSSDRAVKTPAGRESVAITDEQTDSGREEKADLREEEADLREEEADLRQETADLRQEAADQREEAANVKAMLIANIQAQLREANERLVVATIDAQTMTEAAELAAEQMSHMAEHDFLPGLPNRALLERDNDERRLY